MLTRLLKTIYSQLPLVREVRYQNLLLENLLRSIPKQPQLARSLRLLESAAVLSALQELRSSNPRYTDPKRLMVHGAQYSSQFYEDGMISEIFRRIGTTTKTFLEIGVENGAETNTTALLPQGWSGWWIEGSNTHVDDIKRRLASMPQLAARLQVRNAFVTPESIAGLFVAMAVPNELDLFSLDIDLDTYHIWAALPNFRPRVIVVEYNAAIPAQCSWINPYIQSKCWDFRSQDYGASLKAYENLGRERGYALVGCDISGNNAFFVREDLVGDHFASPFTAENHYEPPRYGLWFRWAHEPVLFGESARSQNGLT